MAEKGFGGKKCKCTPKLRENPLNYVPTKYFEYRPLSYIHFSAVYVCKLAQKLKSLVLQSLHTTQQKYSGLETSLRFGNLCNSHFCIESLTKRSEKKNEIKYKYTQLVVVFAVGFFCIRTNLITEFMLEDPNEPTEWIHDQKKNDKFLIVVIKLLMGWKCKRKQWPIN